MGEHVDASSALTFIRGNKFDTTKDGQGNPEVGMLYFNTTENKLKLWSGTLWEEVVSGSVIKSIDLDTSAIIFDDFIGVDLNWYIWTNIKVGNSSLTAIEDNFGIIRIRSGENEGDYCTLSNAIKSFTISDNLIMKSGFKLGHVSDLVAYIGFYDNYSNKVEFRADTSTGYWHTVTSSDGNHTENQTSVSLDTSFHHFLLDMSSSSVVFKIDNNVVATHATNIPSTIMYYRAQVARTAGISVRDVFLDYVYIYSVRLY
jgi:hypothetical protein